jgi:hypothetical protein
MEMSTLRIESLKSTLLRRHEILLFVGMLLAVGLAVSCTGKRVTEANVKMQSTSPDGKYRCVVKEQLPPAGYESPHVYTFTIRDASTDLDLKGESYRRDTDSVSLTDLKFEWAYDELTISLSTVPPRPYLTARFNNGEQRWTSVGN